MESESRLSVGLPAKNEGATLIKQLAAILPQLLPSDELLLLDDGSTDNTWEIMKSFMRPNVRIAQNKTSVGVCRAYNQVAAAAGGRWFLGASGNDEIRPGAFQAFRDAVSQWPSAVVAFGKITNWGSPGWSDRTTFLDKHAVATAWLKTRGWRTHGAAAFVRLDHFPPGYLEPLQWMADWFQTLILSMRHGCIYINADISTCTFGPGQFSNKHNDTIAYNTAIRAMKKEFDKPCYRDVCGMGALFHDLTNWLEERT